MAWPWRGVAWRGVALVWHWCGCADAVGGHEKDALRGVVVDLHEGSGEWLRVASGMGLFDEEPESEAGAASAAGTATASGAPE